MEDENKLPLKRVELSLTKFNEVAIPHHLDLLRQHKANIIKYEESGEIARARAEQTRARRVASQLRTLLLEMDALRQQVRAADRARFDALSQRSRDTTLKAVVDYLGVIESSCRALVRASPSRSRRAGTAPQPIGRPAQPAPGVAASAVSTESVGLVRGDDGEPDTVPLDDPGQIQLQVNDHEIALGEREALLRGWTELQAELRALHDVWQRAQAAALAQREPVAAAAERVERAADNVGAARGHLASAESLRASALGVGGACVGALVGGPLGLCVGAKAGALAAAAGSLLGYVGLRAFAGRQRALPAPPTTPAPPDHDKEQ